MKTNIIFFAVVNGSSRIEIRRRFSDVRTFLAFIKSETIRRKCNHLLCGDDVSFTWDLVYRFIPNEPSQWRFRYDVNTSKFIGTCLYKHSSFHFLHSLTLSESVKVLNDLLNK